MKTAEHEIVVERTVHAGAGDIFAAFTLPELLNRWMTNHAEADLKVGGTYRYELGGPGGETFVHKGQYLTLEPGVLVRQTFVVESEDENPYTDETLELRLKPLSSGRTALRFTNAWNGPAMDEESFEAVRETWEAWFDQLEKFMALVALHAAEGEADETHAEKRVGLTIVRSFDATPEQVFDAWLNPALASQWLFASGGAPTACDLPARVGESWRISEVRDGVEYTATGIYRVVHAPHYLEFTFGMPLASPNFDLIRVQFAAAGALTLMNFEQLGPDIEEELRQVVPGAAGGSEGGWNAMFDTLSKVLDA